MFCLWSTTIRLTAKAYRSSDHIDRTAPQHGPELLRHAPRAGLAGFEDETQTALLAGLAGGIRYWSSSRCSRRPLRLRRGRRRERRRTQKYRAAYERARQRAKAAAGADTYRAEEAGSEEGEGSTPRHRRGAPRREGAAGRKLLASRPSSINKAVVEATAEANAGVHVDDRDMDLGGGGSALMSLIPFLLCAGVLVAYVRSASSTGGAAAVLRRVPGAGLPARGASSARSPGRPGARLALTLVPSVALGGRVGGRRSHVQLRFNRRSPRCWDLALDGEDFEPNPNFGKCSVGWAARAVGALLLPVRGGGWLSRTPVDCSPRVVAGALRQRHWGSGAPPPLRHAVDLEAVSASSTLRREM